MQGQWEVGGFDADLTETHCESPPGRNLGGFSISVHVVSHELILASLILPALV